MSRTRPLIAVDAGNSRIKLGWFGTIDGVAPLPDRVLRLSHDAPDWARLMDWLAGTMPSALDWRLASVNRPAATLLVDWLCDQGAIHATRFVTSGDLPLQVGLPQPDRVGVDRLLNAVAANHLRPPDRAAVVVDLGTAITVDLVSAGGVFEGGAILPGLMTSARALHEFTDLLPLLPELDGAPPELGKTTVEAMTAGVFWGAVGGIRELIARYSQTLAAEPEIVVSGGSGHVVAEALGDGVHYEPHLTLTGIALAERDRRDV